MFKNLKIKRKIIIWSASVFCGIVCFVDTASASISVSRAFYELARQNNTQKIESLLYRGYSLESVDENGYSPVCIAVSRQDRVSYNVLTSYGANKKPSCLKLVPESSYRRFFGSNPVQKEIIKDESDTPYWMGVALLGGGAAALAFALKGGSGGGSGGGSSEEYEEIDGCEPGWQNKDKCTLCKNNYTLSKDGKKCILSIKCPSNSEYNSSTEKCECKKGYGNFGNEEKCYKKIEGCLSQREDKCEKCDENYIHYNDMCYKRVENCKTYEEGKCSDCNEGYILDGNKCIVDCPENSTYNISKKACVCDSGYGKYGQTGDDKCYKSVENCANGEQKNEICNKCKSGYILSDNQCYKKIDNCEIQNADKCIQCESGYDIHGGDRTICYKNLENCVNQNQDKCIVCESGYGVHGDPNGKCYKDVEKCIKYVSNNYTQCQDCELGYIASNGTCWEDINCDKTKGLTQKNNECVCDERRGYTGTPDNCTRAEGEYVEGEGHYDVWSDLNMLYCNSHGIYNTASASCSCNEGYTGVSCSDCDEGFINFDGLCYKEIQCDKEDHRIQYYTSCVCDTGYIEIDDKCIEEKQCGKGMQQGETGECECKPNFVQQDDGTCECPTEEVDGVEYEYDATLDICAPKPKSCDEKNANGDKWAGENCDECPINYQITINEETGIEECRECADNYQKDENGECTQCAEGYMKDAFTDMCVYKECEDGKDGYIIIDGTCVCDESKGYYLGPSGKCQPKKENLVGKTSDINNGIIELENEEFRDVYGMKPVKGTDENGNEIPFEQVYNSKNYNGAEINIKNKNSGSNKVYGIYANSHIYNAAAVGDKKTTAKGEINIEDTVSQAEIYGINSLGEHNAYNAYAYNIGIYDVDNKTSNTNTATGDITINKIDNGGIIRGGKITGIKGEGNIYNAYAATGGELGHAIATGEINIENELNGTVIGIEGTSKTGRINNAYAFLGGPMSNTIADGKITISGKSDIYGIKGNGIIINSETQFNTKYSIIPEFSSYGEINVTGYSNARGEGAYGIFIGDIEGGSETKNEIYNAMGYNATAKINVENKSGGSAYGIYSGVGTYDVIEDGVKKVLYNNTYNAFRSSKVYGGEESSADGKINVKLSGGGDSASPEAVGIYAKGDVFNSYVNSGSDVMLKAEGTITIEDESEATAGSELKGIESNGGTIANAYATGDIKNESSVSKGTINITKSGSARGSIIIGIDASASNESGATIYNAALIGAKSTVDGTINITSTDDFSKIYGIYAGVGENGVGKDVYNSYYDGTEANNNKVHGKINITTNAAQSNADIYGIYVDQGSGYNSYSTIENANVIGEINIKSQGSNQTGGANVIGMYSSGSNSELYNNYNSKINIEINAGRGTYANAYGMSTNGGDAYNNGEISVITRSNNGGRSLYGMHTIEGSITNDEKGTIYVKGNGNNYGMYAETSEGNDIQLINKGTITVEGSNNYGIYAKNNNEETGSIKVVNDGTIELAKGKGIYASGKNVTVLNTGTINVTDGDNIVLENGAIIVNEENIESQSSIDLNSYGGEVLIAKGGSFKSNEDISGNLSVSSSSVMDNFDKNITINDAIVAKDVSNLELLSKSYMYNASLRETSDGKHDIDVSLKDFKEITSEDKAKYYTLNYNKDNGELFNVLKKQETAQAYSKAEREVFGEYVIPNITEEELRVSRSLDNVLISDLFKNNNEDIRVMAGADAVFIGRDDTAELTGYELDSQSMYTLYDKKINNKYRLGLGLSFTHTNTDYNNDSSRKNFMVQGYVPVTYSLSDNIKLVSLAKLGYQDGEYTRYGADNDTYEADTSAITYGLANEIRYSINLGNITLSPFAGLNATGWYNRGIKERGDSLALDIASSHAFSLESALGLYADMVTELDEKSKLTTTLGLAYYHEFANPYNAMNAKIINTLGSYKLRNHSADSRDRGILSAKINYDYKDFSIYGEILQYLEEEYPLKVDLGLRYKF